LYLKENTPHLRYKVQQVNVEGKNSCLFTVEIKETHGMPWGENRVFQPLSMWYVQLYTGG
jgi:hypothetical protein